MNKNLNLVEILKDCPKGTKLYSPIVGEVEFNGIDINSLHPIGIRYKCGVDNFTKDGRLFWNCDGECMLFPSKDERDWSKFNPKQPNKPKQSKFDPKTFQPFDKVLVRRGSENCDVWFPDFVSSPPDDTNNKTLCMCIMEDIAMVIPYNDDTKYLDGTTDEAPEFYRYWED